LGVLSFLLSVVLPSRRGAPRVDEEARLLERVQRGDRAALRALYQRVGGQAMAVAVRVLGAQSEAEEVVQDSFVDVWGRAAQFDAVRGSARAWMLSMVRNRAIDRLRTRGANSRMIDRVRDGHTDRPRSPTPLELAEQREARERVQRALAALTNEQRHAIELAYFEGLSQSEIAARLGEPLGTVKSRVRAAMEKLASLIKSDQVAS
jgi:RNA polymerase sigma-70 factor (ECF subfamily)